MDVDGCILALRSAARLGQSWLGLRFTRPVVAATWRLTPTDAVLRLLAGNCRDKPPAGVDAFALGTLLKRYGILFEGRGINFLGSSHKTIFLEGIYKYTEREIKRIRVHSIKRQEDALQSLLARIVKKKFMSKMQEEKSQSGSRISA